MQHLVDEYDCSYPYGYVPERDVSVEQLLHTVYRVIPYASRPSTMRGTPLKRAMRALDRLDEALKLKRKEAGNGPMIEDGFQPSGLYYGIGISNSFLEGCCGPMQM